MLHQDINAINFLKKRQLARIKGLVILLIGQANNRHTWTFHHCYFENVLDVYTSDLRPSLSKTHFAKLTHLEMHACFDFYAVICGIQCFQFYCMSHAEKSAACASLPSCVQTPELPGVAHRWLQTRPNARFAWKYSFVAFALTKWIEFLASEVYPLAEEVIETLTINNK